MSNTTVWIPRSEGCMGESIPGYWRASRLTLDGQYVFGCDADEGVAVYKAVKAMEERNAILRLSPLEQLDVICGSQHVCQNDLVRAVKLINSILQAKQ